jgi:hypothetical protein
MVSRPAQERPFIVVLAGVNRAGTPDWAKPIAAAAFRCHDALESASA